MTEQVAPQNLEAEESVLGACLLAPSAIPIASDVLHPKDFYRESNAHIFAAILDLYVDGREVDVITLGAQLAQQNLLEEVGGRSYLHTLMGIVPSASNVKHYADIVRENSVLRQLVTAGHQIADLGYSADGATESILEEAEHILFDVARRTEGSDGVDIRSLIAQEMKRVEDALAGKKETGFTSNFVNIDEIIGGFVPGTMNILAARPSIGKTALALNIAQKSAMQRFVAFFSMEMSKREIAERMACSMANVGVTKRRAGAINNDEADRLVKALESWDKMNMHLDDTGNLTMLSLRAKVRRLAAKRQLGLVVIDYLQLMTLGTGGESNRNYELASISRGMKALAREFDVPVLCLSQLSRPNKELTYVPEPRLSDLRDSGALEQDADIVMFLHRQEKKDEPVDLTRIKLIVGKNRTGAIGETYLRFDPQIVRFSDVY